MKCLFMGYLGGRHHGYEPTEPSSGQAFPTGMRDLMKLQVTKIPTRKPMKRPENRSWNTWGKPRPQVSPRTKKI